MLAACTAQPSPPAASPASSSVSVPAPQAETIKQEAIEKYDASIKHSDNLTPIASVARAAPFNTEGAVGSDLAFTGGYAIGGNYDGFTVYDISQPERPSIVSQVYCPGPQNDVTVSGNLLFLSVDLPMSGPGCQSRVDTQGGSWEGIRIFDISDKRSPAFVGAVAAPCGSHTATLIPSDDPAHVYLFATSSPGRVGGPVCQAQQGKMVVVKVPVADPAKAVVAANPTVMPDGASPSGDGVIVGGCHDVTVHAPSRRAAASCLGDGLLLDVSDPLAPKVLDRVQDPAHFGYWHSAVFSADGERVVFSDEFGGGRSTVCDPGSKQTWGANGVYDITGGKLKLRGYFKIPRKAVAPKTCSAHNGSLVPVRGRDVMVQGWYEGGVSVIDFTDPARPKEIAYFTRGHAPYVNPDESGGSWSAYFYNGHIYSSDLFKGLDVLKLTGLPLDDVALTEFNPQTQR